MDMPDTDAHVLMGLLVKHDLTQTEFAELTGIDDTQVSLISSGVRLFTRRHITSICQAFNVSPNCFFPNRKNRSDD